MPSVEPETILGGHLIVPGVGVFTAAVAPSEWSTVPRSSVLTFTPVAGGAPWSSTVVGSVGNLHWVPGRDLLWFRTGFTTLDLDDSAITVVALEGTPLLRLELPGTYILGVRADGAAVVFDQREVKLLAPDGSTLFESPCVCWGDHWVSSPRMDGDGAFWWTSPDKVLQRLGPSDARPAAVPSPEPSRVPNPSEVLDSGLTTPDGTTWKPDHHPDAPPRTGASLRGQAPGRPDRWVGFPYFETIRTLGLAGGGKIWLQGKYEGTTYYGLIDPANPPVMAQRGPVEVPDFPPATPDLPGIWQVVPEDAPAGAFDGTCDSNAFAFYVDDGEIRVATHHGMTKDSVPVTVKQGLVTFPEVPLAYWYKAAITLRYDAVSGHLVGRSDEGEAVRLAKSANALCRGTE